MAGILICKHPKMKEIRGRNLNIKRLGLWHSKYKCKYYEKCCYKYTIENCTSCRYSQMVEVKE